MASTRPMDQNPRIPAAMPVGVLVTGLLAQAFGEDPNQATQGFMSGYATGDAMIAQKREEARAAAEFQMKQEEADRAKQEHVAKMRDAKLSEVFGVAQALRESGAGNGAIVKMLDEELAPLGIDFGKYGSQILANDENLLALFQKAHEDIGSLTAGEVNTLGRIAANKYHPMSPMASNFQQQWFNLSGSMDLTEIQSILKENGLPDTPATARMLVGLSRKDQISALNDMQVAYSKSSKDPKAPKGVDALNEVMRRMAAVAGDPDGKRKLESEPDWLGLHMEASNYVGGAGVADIDKRIEGLNKALDNYRLEGDQLDTKNPEVARLVTQVSALEEMSGRSMRFFFDKGKAIDVGTAVDEFMSEKFAEAESNPSSDKNPDVLRSELMSRLNELFPGKGPGRNGDFFEHADASSWAQYADRIITEFKSDLEASGYRFSKPGAPPAVNPASPEGVAQWADTNLRPRYPLSGHAVEAPGRKF